MHPEISIFPNKRYYSSKIMDSDYVKERKDPSHLAFLGNIRTALVDTKGTESQGQVSRSYSNVTEAERIATFFKTSFEGKSRTFIAKTVQSTGILVGYNDQKKLIKTTLKRELKEDFDVDTIDGYQGREKDFIIISVVRTGGTMGFMKSYRRLNVALTRAKYGLYIFGDCDLLNKHEEWRSLIKVLDNRGSVIKDS